MLNKKNPIFISILFFLLLSLAFSVIAYGGEFLNTSKETKTNLNDVSIEVGKYVKNNKDLLTNTGEVVATINDVPIYENELL